MLDKVTRIRSFSKLSSSPTAAAKGRMMLGRFIRLASPQSLRPQTMKKRMNVCNLYNYCFFSCASLAGCASEDHNFVAVLSKRPTLFFFS